MMHHIDLCSGIGGFSLGFQWAGLSKPVLFCDTDAWCRKVLAKHWPDVPIAEDVKELANDPDRFIPRTDPRNTILTAGYPCQPFSQAGARRGTSDSRHIYPYISEIIAHKRPAWVVLENVYGHLSLGLDEVLNDLANQDYAARPFIFPSGAIVGAPHHRKRLWIIAHTNSHGEPDDTKHEKQGCGELVAHTSSGKCSTGAKKPEVLSSLQADRSVTNNFSGRSEDLAYTAYRQPAKDWWATESRMGDLADGLPTRLDRFDGWEREPEDIPRVETGVKDRVNRLKGLGNAIVPQIAQRIGETIKKAEGL